MLHAIYIRSSFFMGGRPVQGNSSNGFQKQSWSISILGRPVFPLNFNASFTSGCVSHNFEIFSRLDALLFFCLSYSFFFFFNSLSRLSFFFRFDFSSSSCASVIWPVFFRFINPTKSPFNRSISHLSSSCLLVLVCEITEYFPQ